jgi:TonB family protein
MLAYALKSTLILAVAALAALLFRRRSAAARHLVWTAAAAALLALPLLSGMLPALRVPVASTGPTAVFQVLVTSTPLDRLRNAAHVGQAPRPAADPQVRPAAAVPYLTTLWMLGVAVSLLQMLWAYFLLLRVRRSAGPSPHAANAHALARTLGIDHSVAVLETPRGNMPMTCGIFRPTVLMPAGAADWSPERLRIVLLHELAHIRRGDLATHLLARIALSLHWWNPLAWYAWRAFVRERERATDDLVLAAGERASDYAGHLLEIARAFRPEPATAAAALAMARRSELEGRLVAILDNQISRSPAGRRAAVLAALAAVALAAPFAAVEAQDASTAPGVRFRTNVTGQEADVDATIRAAATQKNHEILDRAAAAYLNLSRFDTAQKLLENSLAIRGETSGATSASYAAGLVKLGDLEVNRHRPAEALAFYTKAVSLGDRPEVTPALLYLGLKAYGNGDYSAAEDYFQRILNVDPQGPQAGPALTSIAGIRQHQPGREADAELLYQKAMAVEIPKSYDLADTVASYAMFLRHEGRLDEAKQQDARAAEVRASVVGGKAQSVVSSANAYRVGNGVTAPRLIFKLEPQYTEEARAAKYQGTVLLYIEVQPDGRATNIRVQRSLGLGLDEKAVEAVQQWRFTPGTKDGVPVPVAATIEVNFRLM